MCSISPHLGTWSAPRAFIPGRGRVLMAADAPPAPCWAAWPSRVNVGIFAQDEEISIFTGSTVRARPVYLT
jgi:hypothetical protein